jgi:protein phosphatase
MYFIIEKRLSLGRLTVADATNLKQEHRAVLNRIARSFHFNTAVIVFDVTIETCLARNAARKRNVPREAISDQFRLLENTLRTIHSEGFSYVHRLDEATQGQTAVRIGRYVSRPAQRRVL